MTVSRRELASAVVDMLEDQSVAKVAHALAVYVSESKMTLQIDTLLSDIADESQKRGLLQASVTSSRPIENDQLARLKTFLSSQFGSKSVSINSQIDEDAIGGLRLEAGGKALDMTLRSKLEMLTKGAN